MSLLIALVAVLGMQGPPQVKVGDPFISYFLRTEPAKSDARWDVETVYILTQRTGLATREMWRITLPEKPIHTWVSSKGDVWVLADTTGSLGGPRGGLSALWARRKDAGIIGSWQGGSLLAGLQAKGVYGMAALVDIERSGVSPIGSSGNEQFTLSQMNGAQTLVTAINTFDRGAVTLVQRFPKGKPEDDPLQVLFRDSHGTLDMTVPMPWGLPVRIWSDRTNSNRHVLAIRDRLMEGESEFVASDRWIDAPPSYVFRTPLGRYGWFEFTDTSATLRFLNWEGKELQAVDLQKLGKFRSPLMAEGQLNYRSIRGGPAGGNDEVFTMSDEAGRQFSIQLKAAGDGSLSVHSAVSLGLDHVAKKEPDYPDARLQSETVRRSDDGRFMLTTRRYLQAGRTFTQMTVSAKIHDPIEGDKEIQVWSAQAPLEPLQLRMSGSGRVYGIMKMPKPAKLSEPGSPDFVMLFCWDLDGKLSVGYDLAGLALKWFPNDDAALKEMDLSRLKCSAEGEAAEREIDGIPIPTWPRERLDYTLASGQKKSLIVSTQAGFGMPVLSLAPSP